MNESNKKNLLNELLESITPEEQEKTDKEMILAAKIANATKAKRLGGYLKLIQTDRLRERNRIAFIP